MLRAWTDYGRLNSHKAISDKVDSGVFRWGGAGRAGIEATKFDPSPRKYVGKTCGLECDLPKRLWSETLEKTLKETGEERKGM